jgi:hypothetical protein
MANIICHNNGCYNIYSTVADGFRFESSIDIDQLRLLIKDEHGQRGLDGLEQRLERAHKFGHSALFNETLDDFLCCNRAGKNEAHLTTEQCIAEFLS